jgi:hypothetical protein
LGVERLAVHLGKGSRVELISGDFRYLRVRVPLDWRTRNRVGTIFGGSTYSATDPYFKRSPAGAGLL